MSLLGRGALMVHEQINKPRGFELVCERPFRFEARWRQRDYHSMSTLPASAGHPSQ